MRLAKPWFGTQRVVAGDSWFASVKTARGLADNGLYFIGDVKGGTSLYSVAAITAATGEEQGAWATFTSKLKLGGDHTMLIYSVSHRRGDSVHKFVATCGTTLSSSSLMAYFEDEEERYTVTEFELSRKAPRVLGHFMLAQPTIDRTTATGRRSSRWRSGWSPTTSTFATSPPSWAWSRWTSSRCA